MNRSSSSQVSAIASARSTAVNATNHRTGRSFANLLSPSAVIAAIMSVVAPVTFAAQPTVQPVQVQVINTAAQPAQVEVTKPVQVQGGIEVLNDALYTPYFHTVTVSYPEDTAKFTVPAGKRLIVETVTVHVTQSAFGGLVTVPELITPDGDSLSLAVQTHRIDSVGYEFPVEHFVGTHPIKFRINGASDPTQPTFSIQCISLKLQATVAGYLVDL